MPSLPETASLAKARIRRSYPAQSFEIGPLSHRATRRQLEIEAAQLRNASAHRVCQVSVLSWLFDEGGAQDLACLVLHGAIPIGGPQAQFALQNFIELADGDAGDLSLLSSMPS